MTAGETPIRDPAALQDRVAAWPAGVPVAIDTEFVRERTYYPRLCLVQAAVGGEILLVDALAPGFAGERRTRHDRRRTRSIAEDRAHRTR